MSKDTVIAYWIEAGTGQLCTQMMGPNDIFRGGLYESEVRIKYAVDPVEIVIIQLKRAGNDWEKGEVERLRDKADEIRRNLAQSEEAP